MSAVFCFLLWFLVATGSVGAEEVEQRRIWS